MSTAVISGLIGAVAATFLASYFSNRPAQISSRTGRYRFYYSAALRALSIVLASILVFATMHVITKQPDDVALHLVLGLFTLIAGGYLIIYLLNASASRRAQSLVKLGIPNIALWTLIFGLGAGALSGLFGYIEWGIGTLAAFFIDLYD